MMRKRSINILVFCVSLVLILFTVNAFGLVQGQLLELKIESPRDSLNLMNPLFQREKSILKNIQACISLSAPESIPPGQHLLGYNLVRNCNGIYIPLAKGTGRNVCAGILDLDLNKFIIQKKISSEDDYLELTWEVPVTHGQLVFYAGDDKEQININLENPAYMFTGTVNYSLHNQEKVKIYEQAQKLVNYYGVYMSSIILQRPNFQSENSLLKSVGEHISLYMTEPLTADVKIVSYKLPSYTKQVYIRIFNRIANNVQTGIYDVSEKKYIVHKIIESGSNNINLRIKNSIKDGEFVLFTGITDEPFHIDLQPNVIIKCDPEKIDKNPFIGPFWKINSVLRESMDGLKNNPKL